MAEDLAVTRRRRMLAFLAEQGGAVSLAEANAFSEGKLLAAHQAFSAIMEGIVDGGYATWDGERFALTESGRAEAALAPRSRARRVAPDTRVEPAPAPSAPVAADMPAAPPEGVAAPSVTVGEPAAARPMPRVEPPRRGVRVRLMGLVRRLLGR
ncbi:MAG: hypothetical protein RLZZ299_1340 [Pseudomonadota bacterium]|jgi:hypothetical protein